MKVTFVGGGALRTLGVLRDLFVLPNAAGCEIHLVDTAPKRVETIGELAKLMPEARACGASISYGADLEPALEGADYVYLVIRVGGVVAMERDKEIATRHGFHCHDDFGPSATFIALRTAPVALDIARRMESLCPDAWMLDFTNPVSLITHTVRHYSNVKVVGLCGGDRNVTYDLADIMGWDRPDLDLTYDAVGLNHFGWLVRCWYRGEDFYPLLDERIAQIDVSGLPRYLQQTVEMYQLYGYAMFSSGHCFHWHYHDEMCAALRQSLESQRAEGAGRAWRQDRDHEEARGLIGPSLPEAYWDHDLLKRLLSHPKLPSVGVQLIRGLSGVEAVKMVVSRLNEDAIPNLPTAAITEYSVNVDAEGIRPAVHDDVPQPVEGLTRAILEHQRLVVEAAVTASRRTLELAMLADPLQRDLRRTRALLEELLKANRGEIAEGLAG